jgi:hypothetical protein
MPEATINKVLVYDMRVNGLFGRNRKVKSESFKLAEVPADAPLAVETVRELATKKLNEVKVKGRAAIRVMERAQSVELRESSGGSLYEVRSFMLMSGKTLFAEEVGA